MVVWNRNLTITKLKYGLYCYIFISSHLHLSDTNIEQNMKYSYINLQARLYIIESYQLLPFNWYLRNVKVITILLNSQGCLNALYFLGNNGCLFSLKKIGHSQKKRNILVLYSASLSNRLLLLTIYAICGSFLKFFSSILIFRLSHQFI